MTFLNLRPYGRRSFREASACLAIVAFAIAAVAPRATYADPLLGAPFLSFDSGSGPFAIAVGDLDGNGNADMVVGNNCESTVSVLLARGDGTFYPKFDQETNGAPYSVALADLDGNGSLDIVVANISSNSSRMAGSTSNRIVL